MGDVKSYFAGMLCRFRDMGDGTHALVVSTVPAVEAIHEERIKVAAGDETDILCYPEDAAIPRDEMHYISSVAFEDENHVPTEVQIAIRRGEVLARKCEEDSPVAGKTYWHNDEMVLQEGDRLEIYFAGATAGDNLLAWFHGYK